MSTLSVHLARWDGAEPAFSAHAHVPHDAASTIKITVLAALRGTDPSTPVVVTDTFPSLVPGRVFAVDPAMDSDPLPWRHHGERAPLGWLAERMITHSSNLATNLCAHHVGLAAVADAWRAAAPSSPGMQRLIEDYEAKRAGIDNTVTAADLAAVLRTLQPPELEVLARNAYRVDLAAGLPAGTWIGFKNGWFPGLRHSVGLVRPGDAPAYVLAICYTGPLANGGDCHDPAAGLLARLSTTAWEHRHQLPDS
ncbi:serine hydrolase [Saccharopolyspora sp. NPDC000359]|uniref:serine hydrolase n=1 Tax=Saccharopolyspora sp. NPDC000359 TaxID=3154251 RepID=UPI00332ED488